MEPTSEAVFDMEANTEHVADWMSRSALEWTEIAEARINAPEVWSPGDLAEIAWILATVFPLKRAIQAWGETAGIWARTVATNDRRRQVAENQASSCRQRLTDCGRKVFDISMSWRNNEDVTITEAHRRIVAYVCAQHAIVDDPVPYIWDFSVDPLLSDSVIWGEEADTSWLKENPTVGVRPRV